MNEQAESGSVRRLTHLADEAGKGSREAFDRLCRPDIQDRLRILIDLNLHDGLRRRIDPEDVLQMVLWRAWSDIGGLRIQSTGGFLRWIAAIARNTVRSVNRDEGRAIRDWKRELGPASSCASRLESVCPTPSHCAWTEERRERVVARIAELSEPYREVFVLRMLEGCSEEETARILGLNRSTVSTRLFRASKQLGQWAGGPDAHGG